MIRREALNVEMGIGQSIYQVVNSFTFQQFIDELFLNRKICLHPSPIPDSLLIVLKRSMVLIVMASHSRNSMKQACKAIYDADFLRIQPSSINPSNSNLRFHARRSDCEATRDYEWKECSPITNDIQ